MLGQADRHRNFNLLSGITELPGRLISAEYNNIVIIHIGNQYIRTLPVYHKIARVPAPCRLMTYQGKFPVILVDLIDDKAVVAAVRGVQKPAIRGDMDIRC